MEIGHNIILGYNWIKYGGLLVYYGKDSFHLNIVYDIIIYA